MNPPAMEIRSTRSLGPVLWLIPGEAPGDGICVGDGDGDGERDGDGVAEGLGARVGARVGAVDGAAEGGMPMDAEGAADGEVAVQPVTTRSTGTRARPRTLCTGSMTP